MNFYQHSEAIFIRRLLWWGRRNQRQFPWRLERDAFRVLVAEVLLQRSRGKTVAAVYSELFDRWPTVQALSDAAVEEITDVIRPLGLVRRAAQLKHLATRVAHEGLPDSLEGLVDLPGVGRYAASATLAAAFQRRVPTVDGTSARVYRRYFGLEADKDSAVDEALWHLARAVMPKREVRAWNWAVLDLAASVCLPRVPRCQECPVAQGCERFSQGRAAVSATA